MKYIILLIILINVLGCNSDKKEKTKTLTKQSTISVVQEVEASKKPQDYQIPIKYLGIVDLATTEKNKKILTKILSVGLGDSYYDFHITSCHIDSRLFIVGEEWGAARQMLSIIMMTNYNYSLKS